MLEGGTVVHNGVNANCREKPVLDTAVSQHLGVGNVVLVCGLVAPYLYPEKLGDCLPIPVERRALQALLLADTSLLPTALQVAKRDALTTRDCLYQPDIALEDRHCTHTDYSLVIVK